MSEEIIMEETSERKPYTKPILERVKLSLDETVLGQGCKQSDSQVAPVQGGTGCEISGCNADGS